jgi:4-azaleucine resistance transporter AzlC
MAPILLSVVPFGLVCGVDAMNAGLSLLQALVFSLTVFAGSAQLVATQLIGSDAPLGATVLAALAVNLRFLMYSAGMSPYFARLSPGHKLLCSFIITDQSYALSQTAFADPARQVSRCRYFIGASLGLFVAFQAGNLAGALAGARVPAAWGLEFAIPLAFTALLVLSLRSRSHALAGLIAGVLTFCLSFLPYLLGVFVASAIAIAVGHFFLGEGRDGR